MEKSVKQTCHLTCLFRMLRFVLHVLEGLVTIKLIFPFISPRRRVELIRRWAAGTLAVFNVTVSIKGEVPPPGVTRVVFVSNHISWLDPALIMALRPAHFVAKSEIRAWPVLGWLSEKAGTLFIERGRRHDTARLNQSISQALNAGDCVGLFPEGTTTTGDTIKPFHASLLQAAVQAQAIVYPVAIRYCHPDGSLNIAPAYTDNISFVSSLKHVLAQPAIHAELVFVAPIPAEGRSRRELATEAECAIASALNLAVPCRKPGKPADPPAALP